MPSASHQNHASTANQSQFWVDSLRALAVEEGFRHCGIAPAVEATGFSDLVRWIEAGYAGDMRYFHDRLPAYRHPDSVLAGVRSIVVLAYPYDAAASRALPPGYGKIARYAWAGVDYHDVVHPKLKRLCRFLENLQPNAKARGVIDTAPLLEREFAQLAGLGWRGKNTLLLNKQLGSYFFLACVLTDLDLPADKPHVTSHCGNCTACLDACPTDAFPQVGVLDASRCISYLTIEHREAIPIERREEMGEWLFGCDICQEVCPWNRKPSRHANPDVPSLEMLELASLFTMNDDEFRKQFRHTPLWRAKRRGVLRNAAIILGNQGGKQAIEVLRTACQEEDPLVREAAQWALKKIVRRQQARST